MDELELPDASWRQKLRRSLLAWYARNARDLPWRENRDPYRIWISEIMLQQTQVATVVPYFERFLKRFPDIGSLARAKEESVLRLWEGLGYYRRARQLHKAAKAMVTKHSGNFPTDFEEVLALPGIGRYTAGAITSIAYDQRQPILEANSIRVYCRLWGFSSDPQTTSGQKQLWKFAEAILPRKRSGDLNQAVMELGSEICSPKSPKCLICPAKTCCSAFATGSQESIPVPKKKMRYEDAHEVAVVVWKDNKVLVRECLEGERWAGLWDFPRFSVADTKTSHFNQKVKQLTGVEVSLGKKRTTIKHGVTRFRITLDCFDAKFVAGELDHKNGQWVTVGKLSNIPLSVTGRKISRLLAD